MVSRSREKSLCLSPGSLPLVFVCLGRQRPVEFAALLLRAEKRGNLIHMYLYLIVSVEGQCLPPQCEADRETRLRGGPRASAFLQAVKVGKVQTGQRPAQCWFCRWAQSRRPPPEDPWQSPSYPQAARTLLGTMALSPGFLCCLMPGIPGQKLAQMFVMALGHLSPKQDGSSGTVRAQCARGGCLTTGRQARPPQSSALGDTVCRTALSSPSDMWHLAGWPPLHHLGGLSGLHWCLSGWEK